jgi:hypothetical protein
MAIIALILGEQASLKRRLVFTGLHRFASRKTVFVVLIAVKPLNVTLITSDLLINSLFYLLSAAHF